MNDLEIVSRCKSGDVKAFEILFEKYQTDVLYLCWNILRNREDARDITQDTFTQVFINIKNFEFSSSLKIWIMSIAYRRCIDKLRRENVFNKYVKKIVAMKSNTNINHEDYKFIEDSESLNPVLLKMNHKERVALSLKINLGFSAKEISQVLNCTESTIRVYLYNARNKIKKHLKKRNV